MEESARVTVTGRPHTVDQLRPVASAFPQIELAMVFGSIARGCERPASDVDLAVATRRAHGELISRHLIEQADFMPYRARVLAERRAAWIGR